jgi:hypothetical protein
MAQRTKPLKLKPFYSTFSMIKMATAEFQTFQSNLKIFFADLA